MNIVSATITGSLILNGVNISSITGSESSINALNSFTASAATTGSNQFNGNQTITGSVNITGSLIVTGSIIGTVTTASYVLNAVSASYALVATTSSYALVATSASYAANATSASYALVATSASFATNSDLLDGRDSLTFANTGSNAFVGTQNINGSVAITGSLTTTGAITAQTLNVQQVTSSIVYSSGSNIFGNSISNTQSMTGSVGISGSLNVNGVSTLSGALSGTSASFSSTLTATAFIPSGATVPTNGMYLSAANTLNFATNTTNRLTISSTGIATFSTIVGIGSTPYSWVATSRALQLGDFASISQQHNGATEILSGAYESGSSSYVHTSTGTFPLRLSLNLNDGSINFLNAPTGTAGNAITWSNKLTIASTGAATFSSSVTATAADAAVGLKVIGGTGRFVIYPYFDATYGVLINSYNTAESGYKPMGFQASAYYFLQGAATFSSSVTANIITSTSAGSTQLFLKSTGGGSNRDWQFQTSETAAGDLSIMQSTTAGGATYATKLNITSGGNVGIGTTSPQGKLDIFNSTNAATTPLISIRSDFATIGNYGMIRFGDFTQTSLYQKGALIYESVSSAARGKFHIALENTDGSTSVALTDAKLTVLSSGNVGIGTTSPSEKLTIEGTVIRLQGGVGVTPFAIANNDSDGFRIYDYTAAATRFRIATTGAATFSSSVTATSGYFSSGVNVSGTGIDAKISYNGAYGLLMQGKTAATADAAIFTPAGSEVWINPTGTQNSKFFGSITTAAPSGGTAKPFKIGNVATVTPTSQNRTIEIEIDGTTYYLTAKTTNN